MSKLEQILNCSPLASFMVVEALARYSEQVAQSQPSDYPPRGLVNPQAWIDTAQRIQEILKKAN